MNQNGIRILLIDDEPNDLQAICEILQNAGYSVVSGSNYFQGVRMFERHGADLIVVDVALPQRNGFELARELSRSAPYLKVLFISAYSGAELLRFYGISMEDRHFLAKPFTAEDLKARVREVLDDPVTVLMMAHQDQDMRPVDFH